MLYGYGHLPLAKKKKEKKTEISIPYRRQNICYGNNNKMCTFGLLYHS